MREGIIIFIFFVKAVSVISLSDRQRFAEKGIVPHLQVMWHGGIGLLMSSVSRVSLRLS